MLLDARDRYHIACPMRSTDVSLATFKIPFVASSTFQWEGGQQGTPAQEATEKSSSGTLGARSWPLRHRVVRGTVGKGLLSYPSTLPYSSLSLSTVWHYLLEGWKSWAAGLQESLACWYSQYTTSSHHDLENDTGEHQTVCIMASNYWASTQCRHWQCPPAVLVAIRQELEDREKQLIQQYPLPEWRHLSLFFNQRK